MVTTPTDFAIDLPSGAAIYDDKGVRIGTAAPKSLYDLPQEIAYNYASVNQSATVSYFTGLQAGKKYQYRYDPGNGQPAIIGYFMAGYSPGYRSLGGSMPGGSQPGGGGVGTGNGGGSAGSGGSASGNGSGTGAVRTTGGGSGSGALPVYVPGGTPSSLRSPESSSGASAPATAPTPVISPLSVPSTISEPAKSGSDPSRSAASSLAPTSIDTAAPLAGAVSQAFPSREETGMAPLSSDLSQSFIGEYSLSTGLMSAPVSSSWMEMMYTASPISDAASPESATDPAGSTRDDALAVSGAPLLYDPLQALLQEEEIRDLRYDL